MNDERFCDMFIALKKDHKKFILESTIAKGMQDFMLSRETVHWTDKDDIAKKIGMIELSETLTVEALINILVEKGAKLGVDICKPTNRYVVCDNDSIKTTEDISLKVALLEAIIKRLEVQ